METEVDLHAADVDRGSGLVLNAPNQAMGGWSRKSLRMLARYAAVSTEHQAAAIRRVA